MASIRRKGRETSRGDPRGRKRKDKIFYVMHL
jgi:hypothetical protein